ncbi:MAG: uncharacterized protein KVP18_001984 [Porospora cf. gigantea A]|uniref:uncharacterized protein n=1 Tax=Porospora cf. gigantea A TaxID=2853593 RepID=UPI0035598D7E|nr:MAG: hypothetical protein KVP18_001984 [Porospora cf. gigantea A]
MPSLPIGRVATVARKCLDDDMRLSKGAVDALAHAVEAFMKELLEEMTEVSVTRTLSAHDFSELRGAANADAAVRSDPRLAFLPLDCDLFRITDRIAQAEDETAGSNHQSDDFLVPASDDASDVEIPEDSESFFED